MKENEEAKVKKPMTFKEVLSCLQQANEVIPSDSDVALEVWLGEKMYKIIRVGQFGVIPDVTLTLADKPFADLT